MQRFADAGKPIAGLETARSQLMLFETLDPKTQRALLTHAAERAGDAVAEVHVLADAWSRGDVAALEREINEDVDAVPEADRKSVVREGGCPYGQVPGVAGSLKKKQRKRAD